MKIKKGEKLEREEVDTLVKECCDEEDADGFIPYERKLISLLVSKKDKGFMTIYFPNFFILYF